MKKLFVILISLVLVSCSREASDFLSSPHLLEVTLEHGGVTLDGRLDIKENSLTFYPEEYGELTVEIREDGSTVTLGGIKFENVGEMSRLNGIYRELKDGSVHIAYDKNRPSVIEGRGFKIKIHKEIIR